MIGALAEIKPGQELATLTTGIKAFIARIKLKVDFVNIDMETKKGRDAVISNAFKVTKSKTGICAEIDKLIAQKNIEIAPALKIIELLKESKKVTNTELGALAKDVRQVVTDWEIDQAEIAAKLQADIDAKANAEKREFDHDVGLIINENIDYDRAEQKRLNEETEKEKAETEEIARVERENEIREQAKQTEIKRQNQERINQETERQKLEADAFNAQKVLKEIADYLAKTTGIEGKLSKAIVISLLNCDRIKIKY